MNKVMWISLALFLSVALAGMAWAADKTPKDPNQDWEKHPEPALQVYKTTGRGIHALVYQSLRSLKEGNERLPILGSVMVFEGIGSLHKVFHRFHIELFFPLRAGALWVGSS